MSRKEKVGTNFVYPRFRESHNDMIYDMTEDHLMI